jgi:hypothetical protein
LKISDPGIQKIWPFFQINLFVFISLKLAKIIGVYELKFFSKIVFYRFLTTTKYAQIKKLYKICNITKWLKISFREKVHLTDPYYFC